MFSAVKIAVAAAIVALFGGFLLVGVLDQEPPEVVPAMGTESPTPRIELVPTGVETLSPATGTFMRLVADGTGVLWAHGTDGRLVRHDPAAETTRTWTAAADRAIGATNSIAPATGSGVWLVNPDGLRLFDGVGFRQVIETPVEVGFALEAPDSTLWATTETGEVLRWDGSAWYDLGPGQPDQDTGINAFTVDSEGRPWVGWLGFPAPPGTGGVSVLEGSEWTTFDGSDAAPLSSPVWSIAELPDGAIWVATAGGIARFDGATWTDVSAQGIPGRYVVSVAAAPDGTVWAATGLGSIRVWRLDGDTWTTFGPADGLPSSASLVTAWIVPTGDDVFVGTGAGTYHLAEDRWEPAWAIGSARIDVQALSASGGDELWVAGDQGTFHYLQGDWTEVPLDPDRPRSATYDLDQAPDGTVWIAGADGLAHWQDGAWTLVDEDPVGAVAVESDGTVWASGGRPEGPCQLWSHRQDGSTWARHEVLGCPLPSSWGLSLAVDQDGGLWVGGRGGYFAGGLARYDGEAWASIGDIGDSELYGSRVIGTDPSGGVWVEVQSNAGTANEVVIEGVRLARFAGTEPTLIELPSADWDWDGPVLAPDGALWAASDRGPARFDGDEWVFPYEDVATPWMKVDAVAAGGTVFGADDSSIYRLPPRIDPPPVIEPELEEG
jgi:ligand-binding sensor domain-containing protein